jgi:hypothetical protein
MARDDIELGDATLSLAAYMQQHVANLVRQDHHAWVVHGYMLVLPIRQEQ